MTLSEELTWRGFVNQTTFKDITELDKASISFYWGVDPSADSMHIGQLAMAMMIRHFIAYGHKATLLVGGATGMIGDPDGKAEERDLKSVEEIGKNRAGIAAQYQSLFDGLDFDMVDNYDWFKEMGYLAFLRDAGKHFSMTQLLDRDFVQKRIGEGGSGISYAEFSYSLIQGYDFLHLFREKGITLQVAGADQWGNSISGVQLIRKLEGKDAHIWTAPLIINKATGKKFGKSETGAVWLSAKRTSPQDFYQFWLNVDDEGVIGYLKIYTLFSREEIEDIEQRHSEAPHLRIAQRTLAGEVTRLVHGDKQSEEVSQGLDRIHSILRGDIKPRDLDEEELRQLAQGVMSVRLVPTAGGPAGGKTLMVSDSLVKAGVASSKGNARRLIEAGAVSRDGVKLTHDVMLEYPTLLRKGKSSFVLVY